VTLSPLYAVLDTDVAAAHGWTVPDLARACCDGGARLLQVRAKTLASGSLLALADEVVRTARPYGADVIVNDRADVARMADAAGVHVGQEDLAPSAVRRVVGAAGIVGLSTHTIAQIERARREPITYLAVGPVFGTASKDTGYEAVGLGLVREAVRFNSGPGGASGDRIPVVAIGGITLDLAPSVVSAGASSVAVISDLFVGGNPHARVREYLARLAG
jgi:thiamine-phosphate pyrophosphorylase